MYFHIYSIAWTQLHRTRHCSRRSHALGRRTRKYRSRWLRSWRRSTGLRWDINQRGRLPFGGAFSSTAVTFRTFHYFSFLRVLSNLHTTFATQNFWVHRSFSKWLTSSKKKKSSLSQTFTRSREYIIQRNFFFFALKL